MQYTVAEPTSTQTNTALIPAQSGKVIKVKFIFISTDTAGTVSLENSTTHGTELIKVYLAANGGLAIGPETLGPGLLTLVGEGVDYTFPNGNGYVMVGWEV